MTEPIRITAEQRSLFPALGYPQYRFLWISALGAYIGRWIETVVGAWLVLELTNSPFMVGLLGTCRFTSMLLGPFCGTISDRFSRRSVLLVAQLVYATSSFIVLILFAYSQIEVWHLFAFTLIAGTCFTFDFSTRYAIAADIVKSQHIISSTSLLQVAFGVTSIVGPLLGGSLLEVIGASGCFTLVTVSFVLAFAALLPIKIQTQVKLNNYDSIWKNLAKGLRYIKEDRVLFSLILIAALANLFIFPYCYTLIPIFARDVLDTGASGFGQLMAAIGLGAIIGSLITGILPQSANRGKLLIAAMIAWPAILMIFSFSASFYLSLILLIIIGTAQGISMVLIQALLLMRSSKEMRGRVSGARAFAIGALPLGTLLTGYGASLWGAPIVLITNSSASILITIFVAIWASELIRHK